MGGSEGNNIPKLRPCFLVVSGIWGLRPLDPHDFLFSSLRTGFWSTHSRQSSSSLRSVPLQRNWVKNKWVATSIFNVVSWNLLKSPRSHVKRSGFHTGASTKKRIVQLNRFAAFFILWPSQEAVAPNTPCNKHFPPENGGKARDMFRIRGSYWVWEMDGNGHSTMLMRSFAPRLAKNILQIHALKQNILDAPILPACFHLLNPLISEKKLSHLVGNPRFFLTIRCFTGTCTTSLGRSPERTVSSWGLKYLREGHEGDKTDGQVTLGLVGWVFNVFSDSFEWFLLVFNGCFNGLFNGF